MFWRTKECRVDVANAATTASSSRKDKPGRREVPYFMDEDGHVYSQDQVGGPTVYLGNLLNMLNV